MIRMERVAMRAAPLSLALISAACQAGVIGNAPGQNDPNDPTNTHASSCETVEVAPAPLRRLTGKEWARSVSAAFGVDVDLMSAFPPEPYSDGFDNGAD